ncbi:uncharacterized protein E0L32_003840 [Thyridium curvatum]|uniref:15-hydroxyprostaglandin dehydrogenase n=1 Tax=Thyridium curvatum TaxID=1093900 RepID=A0A507BBD3_9PEZI|nr:uncharacterized protein E0L32_003840 [Thyridium curvatum]TPX16546.1 hypothetical protein E0L32_003840 [Thyridium curvatum]
MATNGTSVSPNKVAIVTGASSGMGTALSKHFIGKGWNVALLDVNDKVGKDLASSLGPNAAYFHANVASYASQAAAFTAVWERWGRLDALLANAGIVDQSSLYILRHRGASVADVPPEPNLLCTDVDYKGVLYGTQLAVHFMRHNPPGSGGPGGKIVCTASNAGVHPHRSYPEYNGAKAGVVQFVRTVADVLAAKERVYVNCVCPGIVATAIVPPEMVAAVSPECMTPVGTIVRAYDGFLAGGDARFGVVAECSGELVSELDYSQLKFKNGRPSERSVTVWDPLFRDMHGEDSGLAEALP